MSPSDLRDKTAQWKSTGSGFPCNYGLALHVELDRTVILSNEAVEKVSITKKVHKSGAPKWYLVPRSSLKRPIRRSFYAQIFRSTFFYRLNAAAERRELCERPSQAGCYATLCILVAKSRPEVGGGNGLPSFLYSSIASSTIWHSSSKTSFSSLPWQPPYIKPGALPT